MNEKIEVKHTANFTSEETGILLELVTNTDIIDKAGDIKTETQI